MAKHKEQRVAILVDVQNMYHSAKNLYNARVNFKEIMKAAVAGRRLVQAYAYVIKSQAPEEQGFFDALASQGFEIRIKDLQIFAGGAKKGDWDVGLAMDAIRLASKVDVIVLVTGDGDFVPLVRYLRENQGCQVELLAFRESGSGRLIEEVDDFIDLSEGNYLLKIKR
jgi:uncharacterized protein (TIGR00288 family)